MPHSITASLFNIWSVRPVPMTSHAFSNYKVVLHLYHNNSRKFLIRALIIQLLRFVSQFDSLNPTLFYYRVKEMRSCDANNNFRARTEWSTSASWHRRPSRVHHVTAQTEAPAASRRPRIPRPPNQPQPCLTAQHNIQLRSRHT